MNRASLPPTPASITERFVSLKHQIMAALDVPAAHAEALLD